MRATRGRLKSGRSTLRTGALALAAALLLVLCLGGASASTQSQIVVYGAHSGSHLQLTTHGNHLVVSGWMAEARPNGCQFTRYRHVATCNLANAGSIELSMGPGGDMVEVLDPLPIPLTIRLGDGSDKFIGSAEVDICYPEGSRRNRCIGGGGDDICITGSRNSDCVGGSGNDYCKHGAGSDGCWGGPGRDVCVMGAGHDGCHGEGGNDRLYGGASSDRLYGGAGRDHCDGGRGRGRSEACESGPRR